MVDSSLTISDRGLNAKRLPIKGGGGRSGGKGGGGSGGSVEAADTLFSVSNARILVALGEGPLEGPATDDFAKSLIINGTPLVSPSGDRNFKGFNIEWRNGTADQSFIPGFSNREQEYSVTQKVFKGSPVVRTILNRSTDAVRVRIRIPTLREIRADGSGSIGSEVRYQIEVASAGSSYEVRYSDGLGGKTTSAYERSHTIRLTGRPPWNVRLVRVTADSTSERIANDLIFQAITEIEYKHDAHPDTALIGVLIDARQFSSSIPSVFLNTRGLRILVPHNYDAYNATYNGFFDGSLKESWTNNPVWVLLDLLTDTRYGAGLNFSRIDLASFYAAAVHCDERISNGEGGTERRHVFNGSIETREGAFKVCEAVASTFHGLMYWSGSKIRLTVDNSKKPFRTYSRSNVLAERDEDGRLTAPPFLYSDVSFSSIHTVANISFRDPDNGYQLKTIQYVNPEGVARWGYRPVDITAFGCTSRTQAYRYGKWRIVTELSQLTSVAFRVGPEGILSDLGDVVYLYDTALMGEIRSGRVISSTATSVTLDNEVALGGDGGNYEILTTGRDGRSQYHQIDLIGSSQSSAGKYKTVSVKTSYGTNQPAEDTIWGIVGGIQKPQQFKVTNIEEAADNSYKIEAVQYEPSKFGAVESNLPLTFEETFTAENPYAAPKPVENLTAEEFLFSYTGSSGIRVRLDLSWSHTDEFNSRAERFKIDLRRSDDLEWQTKGESATRSFFVNDISPGAYEVRITAISPYGVSSAPTIAPTILYGLTAAPKALANFSSQYFSGSLKLSWSKTADLDVRIGGDILIYHTPILNAVDNGRTAALVATLPGDQTQHLLAPLSGTYYIQARDSTGNLSSTLPSLTFDGQSVLARNVALEINESPDFLGAKQNAQVDPVLGVLKITNKTLRQAIYDFQSTVDLGGVMQVRLVPELAFSVVNESELFDSAPGLFDSRAGLFDSQGSNEASAVLEFRTSIDGTTYTDWGPLVSGDYSFRFCQLRLMMTTTNNDYNVFCSLLRVLFDVDDLIQEGSGLTSAAGTTAFSFRRSFFQSPLIVSNLKNANSGDYIRIDSQTNSGFSASAYNSTGARIAKEIVYIAKGY